MEMNRLMDNEKAYIMQQQHLQQQIPQQQIQQHGLQMTASMQQADQGLSGVSGPSMSSFVPQHWGGHPSSATSNALQMYANMNPDMLFGDNRSPMSDSLQYPQRSLSTEAKRKSSWRANLSEEKLREIREKQRERTRIARSRLTEEQKQEMREKQKIRARDARARMSEQKKQEVLEKGRLRARERRMKMNTEEREVYLERQRVRTRELRKNMTDEEKNMLREKWRTRVREVRANWSEEQKQNYRRRSRDYSRQYQRRRAWSEGALSDSEVHNHHQTRNGPTPGTNMEFMRQLRSEYTRRRRENESAEDRQKRLESLREYMMRRKEWGPLGPSIPATQSASDFAFDKKLVGRVPGMPDAGPEYGDLDSEFDYDDIQQMEWLLSSQQNGELSQQDREEAPEWARSILDEVLHCIGGNQQQSDSCSSVHSPITSVTASVEQGPRILMDNEEQVIQMTKSEQLHNHSQHLQNGQEYPPLQAPQQIQQQHAIVQEQQQLPNLNPAQQNMPQPQQNMTFPVGQPFYENQQLEQVQSSAVEQQTSMRV